MQHDPSQLLFIILQGWGCQWIASPAPSSPPKKKKEVVKLFKPLLGGLFCLVHKAAGELESWLAARSQHLG